MNQPRPLLDLLRYHGWAQHVVTDEAVRHRDALPPRTWTLACHLANAQTIWNARLDGISAETPGVWDEHPADVLRSLAAQAQSRTRAILAEATAADTLGREVDYADTRGESYATPLTDILLHLANHGTHHRGQIVTELRRADVAPRVTDYIAWTRQGKPDAPGTPKLDLQPTLTGTRVRARPLQPDDRERLRAAAADPTIWAQHPAKRHRPEVFAPFFDAHLASGGALLVEDVLTGEVIGTTRYLPLDADTVEIGWTFLTPAYWGTGANAELKRLMVSHARTVVPHVVLVIHVDNERSLRAAERVGARPLPRDHPLADHQADRSTWLF